MQKDNFTVDHVRELCRLYDHYLGGEAYCLGNSQLEFMVKKINESGFLGWTRIGSRYGLETELAFFPDQDGNVLPQLNLKLQEYSREAEYAAVGFIDAACQYLSSLPNI
jgi:hypothetical protein